MNITVLRKYAPLYISLLVTAMVMLFLFLRPGEALGGLVVQVDSPQNERNQQAGHKLGEAITIAGSVDFEGGGDVVTAVTFSVTQNTGDAGFTPLGPVSIPLEAGTHTLTIGQGTLSVDVAFSQLKRVSVTGGYGYGYNGVPGGIRGGKISHAINYTPPTVAGDYTATLTVTRSSTPTDTSSSTTFSILKPLSASTLATLYPATEDGTALPTDMVVLQLDLTNTKPSDIFKATVSSSPINGSLPMVDATKIHPSLGQKWGLSTSADLALPMRVGADAIPGTFGLAVTAEDIAGQVTSLTASAGPKVKVASARNTFNLYLLPTFNFVSSPLQCVGSTPLCSASNEFLLEELFKQTVPRSALNSAFTATISGTGDIPLNKIILSAFRYDGSSGFKFFDVPTSTASGFESLGVSRGYVLKTTVAAGNISPFKTNTSGTQFPSTPVTVPVKLTLTGRFIADSASLPPSHAVDPKWNLVGAHSEVDSNVGLFLTPVTVPQRLWETIISFRNLLDIDLDSAGKVRLLPGGESRVVFETKFRTLLGPDFAPPAGEVIPVGSGLWLFMCEAPASTCKGGELLPVPR